MAQAEIPVDLLNPGQVFACLGFLELALVIAGDADAGFAWDADITTFRLSMEGAPCPFMRCLKWLAGAEVCVVVPTDAGLIVKAEKDKLPVASIDAVGGFAYGQPEFARLPALLKGADGRTFTVNHWADAPSLTGRHALKFWAGGKAGASLARDALDLVRDQLTGAHADPLNLAVPQSSSFRFDWRRDYVPLDIGFSLDRHKGKKNRISSIGYPLVELLAAVGLSHARPQFVETLQYRYGVLGAGTEETLVPPCLLRAALGCVELPFPRRIFRMQLGRPEQDGKGARCVTSVIEEHAS